MAFSSRNFLLSQQEKIIASKVIKLLRFYKNKIIKGKNTITSIKKIVYGLGVNKIDYIKLLNINKLIIPYKKNKNYKIFISFYLGNTRLIDNI